MKPKKAPSAYEGYGDFQKVKIELGSYVSFDVGVGALVYLTKLENYFIDDLGDKRASPSD